MINGNNKRERDEHENDVIKPWCVYIQLADAEDLLKTKDFRVRVHLDMTGAELLEQVAEESTLTANNLRFLFSGKFIDELDKPCHALGFVKEQSVRVLPYFPGESPSYSPSSDDDDDDAGDAAVGGGGDSPSYSPRSDDDDEDAGGS